MNQTAEREHITRIRYDKVTMFLLNFIGWTGFPLLGIALLDNMDAVKSTILYVVSLSMVVIRFYYWMITARQNKKLKNLKIQYEELELIKKRQDADERRIELFERELTIRSTGKPKQ
jgi:hypothetical protein